MPTSDAFKVYKDDDTKLKSYRHKLELADQDFQGWEKEAGKFWGRYEQAHTESQYTEDGHRVVPSVGIGEIDAMYAALTATEVDITVTNVGAGTVDQARLAEAGIKEVWREQKVQRRAEDMVKDALVSDIGFVKVAYEYHEEDREVPKSDEKLDEEVSALFEAAEAEGAPPPAPEQVAALIDPTEVVTEVIRDRIVIDYVPWDELRWDHAAKGWEDCRWVAQVSKVPVDEVKANPVYRAYVFEHYGERKGKKLLDDLVPDSSINTRRSGRRNEDVREDDRLTLVEFYDFHAGTRCTFPKHGDVVLLESPNPFALNDDLEDKNPFVAYVVRKARGKVRGIGDMRLMSPTLDELEEYRSNLATYVARTIPKIMGREGILTEAGKNALKSLDWGAFVELTDDASALSPLNPPPLPQEVFGIPQRLVEEIREVTGSSELARGLFPDRRQTATTTLAVSEAGNVRQSEKRNRLEQAYVDIARRILMLMQMFYDQERISRVVELEGDVEWSWNAEDITMESQLEVHLSPKEAQTRQTRRDFAVSVLNLVAPMPNVDLTAVAAWALEEGGVPLAKVREFLKTAEEMQQDQMAALQLQQQQQSVAEGESPDAAAVPGPQSGAELAASTNPGEVPEDVAAALALSYNREVEPAETPLV